MAINRLRLSAPLIRGNVPEEHAAEFTDALVSEVEREIEPLVARSEMEEAINRAVAPLIQVVQDLQQDVRNLRQEFQDLRVEMADRQIQQEHRTTTLFIGAVAITIAAIGIGTGVTIAVLT